MSLSMCTMISDTLDSSKRSGGAQNNAHHNRMNTGRLTTPTENNTKNNNKPSSSTPYTCTSKTCKFCIGNCTCIFCEKLHNALTMLANERYQFQTSIDCSTTQRGHYYDDLTRKLLEHNIDTLTDAFENFHHRTISEALLQEVFNDWYDKACTKNELQRKNYIMNGDAEELQNNFNNLWMTSIEEIGGRLLVQFLVPTGGRNKLYRLSYADYNRIFPESGKVSQVLSSEKFQERHNWSNYIRHCWDCNYVFDTDSIRQDMASTRSLYARYENARS